MTWKCTCLGETALLPPEGVGAKLSQLLVRRGWESKAFFLLEVELMLGKPRLRAGIALNVELPVQGEVRAEEHLEETLESRVCQEPVCSHHGKSCCWQAPGAATSESGMCFPLPPGSSPPCGEF